MTSSNELNGAEALVHTLLKSGVDTCFANPGTSEMHFVGALDRIPGMHCVLGLQENVVTGMADGYYRIAGKAACTLLHCGPGLANGMGNLHNARRARAGIVNIVGDQATYHRPLDAPLTADTEGMARTVSHWVRTSMDVGDVGRDAAVAVQAANEVSGQISTLILPADSSWNQGGVVAEPLPPQMPPPIDPHAVVNSARVLHGKKNVLILLADKATHAPALGLAWRLAQATGADLLASYSNAHMQRGRGRVALERVPYGTDAAIEALSRYEHIILVNAVPPVGFFAYPGKPSTQYSSNTQLHVLSRIDQDPVAALQALVDELGAPEAAVLDVGPRPEVVGGPVTEDALGQNLAALMPENAIISNESVSFGRNFYKLTHTAPAHDWLNLAGGAIGDGLPVATGAAVAAKGQRRVISLQADGSAMYSLQSLWTQARERLPCTTILLNNRKYNILIGEYKNVGAVPGATAMGMLDLSNPDINWVGIANSLGVEAARATTMEECAALMKQSFGQPGPFLIDLVI
ncbi:acetolactate synthase large subunit [Sulfitobacter pacificus]|mgnify:CR=1 FL=1|jgi:acetolactate synthase-1/2/3 large subunit|uniref:Acetolactate synthase I/II/III large subunit n=1 Tax=Sulfitobacter pacificus TaxID=1499314 RepID=A0ABQ5VPE2_9RHOB|nr:acetolactate synthase large subunit [Sulfitobacter pacificus]GLQ29065.1 acetolactate synthase I/II/III large subunit [Sulfitobacter pacificus]